MNNAQAALKELPLHSIHIGLGANMGAFAGWEMPFQYTRIKKEHLAVRKSAGLFDVSHMGEIVVSGSRSLDFLQRLLTNDVSRLSVHDAQYTIMTSLAGTCIDDLILVRIDEEEFLLIVNASNKEKDLAWIQLLAPDDVEVTDISDQMALLALQGPKALAILNKCTNDSADGMKPFTHAELWVRGIDNTIDVFRTGYTGEQGFELMIPVHRAQEVWKLLMEHGESDGLIPCGLSARNTLRLEAGLALHGMDIDESRTPLEANLMRFVDMNKPNRFIGQTTIKNQQKRGEYDVLVGLEVDARSVARSGSAIQSIEGDALGSITSGTSSPTLGTRIAMGYVPLKFSNVGTDLVVIIRDEKIPAQVVKLPFYKRTRKKKEEERD